jgi:hypothetical protein
VKCGAVVAIPDDRFARVDEVGARSACDLLGGFAEALRPTRSFGGLAAASQGPRRFLVARADGAAVDVDAMPALLSDSSIGADITAVMARLGPPLACREVDGEVHLGYLGADGALVPDGVVLADGVVVRERAVLRSPPVMHGYWIGQPIERVLPRFGPVLAVAEGRELQQLTFAAWHVCVHEGRVVFAAPARLTAAS